MDTSPIELTLDLTHRLLDAAVDEARSRDVRMNIVVVDAGAHLKGFLRMDGALLGSVDIAIRKARTASLFEMETGDLGNLSQPGGPLYDIEQSNGGLIIFAGGVPLKTSSGVTIGAIGVSGSTVENDRAVALAGAKALTAPTQSSRP